MDGAGEQQRRHWRANAGAFLVLVDAQGGGVVRLAHDVRRGGGPEPGAVD
jgi:hypothetical protein